VLFCRSRFRELTSLGSPSRERQDAHLDINRIDSAIRIHHSAFPLVPPVFFIRRMPSITIVLSIALHMS
jgi:hypothetical protein